LKSFSAKTKKAEYRPREKEHASETDSRPHKRTWLGIRLCGIYRRHYSPRIQIHLQIQIQIQVQKSKQLEKLAAVSLTQYENLWPEAGVENAARK